MFYFLQPILLLSAAGIAIPVIIHLRNVRPGKTLKVGSISLLTQGAVQNARSPKLHDFLLLFLRCLLIALLAIILAQPLWQQQLSAKKEKGWILLEKENLHESYNRFKPRIDSLVKSGYEFHYFNKGFQKDDLAKALNSQKDTSFLNRVSYWSLLKELNQAVPSNLPVVLFVRNNLTRFSGERPSLSLNIHMQTYFSADSVSTWISKAFLTPADSIHLITGHSNPLGTFYTYRNLSLTNMSASDYTIKVDNGKLMISLRDSEKPINGVDSSSSEVDTSTISVTIFSDKYRNDANYIGAALESIKRFSQRKLQLAVVNNYKDIQANEDWLFWISEQNIPSYSLAKNIFLYENGKVQNVHTWVVSSDEINENEQLVAITKNVAQKMSNASSEIIWSDGYGNPLLIKDKKSNTSVYHFYSRFDPEWNDLPWSKEFPKIMFSLLFDDNNYDLNVFDKRMIDDKQAQPFLLTKEKVFAKDKFAKKSDITQLIWLVAFVIFCIERLVSFNTKKR